MPKRNGNDYVVGYRKPPAETRFPKGASGNPGGRPRRSKSLVELFWAELGNRISINENGRRKSINKLQAMVKQVVNRALAGNERSAKLILQLIRELDNRETVPCNSDGSPRLSVQFYQDVLAHIDRGRAGLAEKD